MLVLSLLDLLTGLLTVFKTVDVSSTVDIVKLFSVDSCRLCWYRRCSADVFMSRITLLSMSFALL